MQPAPSPENDEPFRAPHPLAVALIERLSACSVRGKYSTAVVLDFGSGSGRNSAALERAGLRAIAVDDATASSTMPFDGVVGRLDAVLSTHGLLHGTTSTIAAHLRTMASLLKPRGLLYATFGSVRDARYGRGERLDDATFAPLDGDETGVPHTFFDRPTLATLLQSHFTIESLEERTVDKTAGAWAHSQTPLANAIHWFLTAARRADEPSSTT